MSGNCRFLLIARRFDTHHLTLQPRQPIDWENPTLKIAVKNAGDSILARKRRGTHEGWVGGKTWAADTNGRNTRPMLVFTSIFMLILTSIFTDDEGGDEDQAAAAR